VQTEERDASRSELKVAKIVELAAAINRGDSARETSLQMKSLSGEKEAALAGVTELQSMLRTHARGIFSLSMLEDSATLKSMYWLQNRRAAVS
jgi:hypothetical protein